MFPDLFAAHALLITVGQPEKCSQTYPGFRSSRLTHAANLKNVRGPIRADLSFTRVSLDPKNVPRPILR